MNSWVEKGALNSLSRIWMQKDEGAILWVFSPDTHTHTHKNASRPIRVNCRHVRKHFLLTQTRKTATFWALVLQIAFLFFSRKQTVVRRAAKISRNVFIVHSRPRPGLLCCLLGDTKVLSHEMDFLLQKKKVFSPFLHQSRKSAFKPCKENLNCRTFVKLYAGV